MANYFQLSQNAQSLSSSLEIRAPGGITAGDGNFQRDRASSVLSFSRTREVLLPLEALGPYLEDLSTVRFELQSLRASFEAAWLPILRFGADQAAGAGADRETADPSEPPGGGIPTPAIGLPAGGFGRMAAEGSAEATIPYALVGSRGGGVPGGYVPITARILGELGRSSAVENLLPRLRFDPEAWLRPKPVPDLLVPSGATANASRRSRGGAVEDALSRAVMLVEPEPFASGFRRAADASAPAQGESVEPETAPPAEPAQPPSRAAEAVVVLRIGERGACWLLRPAVGWSPAELHKGLTGNEREGYVHAWQDGIVSAEPLWETPFEGPKPWTLVEEVDLGLSAIVDEMQKAKARLDMYATLIAGADADIKNKPAASEAAPPSGSGGTPEHRWSGFKEIRDAAEALADLHKQQFELKDAVHSLQQRARRLGYLISLEKLEGDQATAFIAKALGSGKDNLPEGAKPPEVIEACRLYKFEHKTHSWKETYKDTESYEVLVGWTFFRHPNYEQRTREVERVRQRTIEYTGVEEIPVDSELWMVRFRQLVLDGMDCHVLRLTDGGYRDEQGNRLGDLMLLADRDEGFRRQLALFYPIYEQSLIEGMVQSKMLVVQAPRSGMRWGSLPKIFLEEQYSYRTHWLGTEAGELVSSLNLAPGESRKISVTRTFNYTSSRTTSVTSVLDVAEASADDLASTIERERRKEQTESQSLSWNVKASGSNGVVSGEASASGSTSRTASEFARDFENLARKSARSMTRNSSLEVTTSDTASTSITRSDESVGEVRNINQGRTMNLLFNRLYNVYRGGIFLEDIRIVVLPAKEILKGSGFVEPITFRLLDMSKAVFIAASDIAGYGGRDGADGAKISKILEDAVWAELSFERGAASPAQAETNARALFPRGALLQSGSNGETSDVDGRPDGDGNADDAGRAQAALRLLIPEAPVTSHVLRVPAAALYLDVVLGVGSATEPYSEEARGIELEQRRADVERTRAAAAALVAGAGPPDARDARRTLREPVILSCEATGDELVVKLSQKLGPGMWQLRADDRTIALVEGGVNEVRAKLDGAAPPLAGIALVDMQDGLIVRSDG